MKHSKLKKYTAYVSSVYVAQFLRGIASIIIKNILGPLGAGRFEILKLIYSYMIYGHLGIRFAADKSLPAIHEEGDASHIRSFEKKSAGGLLILELLIAAVGIVCFALFYSGPVPLYLIVISFASGVAVSCNEFQKVIYRAEKKTGEMTRYVFNFNVLLSASQLASVFLWGLPGLVWTILGVNILFYIVYFILHKKRPLPVTGDFKFIGHQIKEGYPLLVRSLCVFGLLSVDRLFVVFFFDEFSLGIYSVAVMFFSMLMLMPDALLELLFPDLLIAVKSGNLRRIFDGLFKQLSLLSSAFYVLISLFVLIVPFFLKYVMPAYVDSIRAVQVLAGGVYCIAVSGLCGYALVGLEKNRRILWISFTSMILACTFNALFIFFVKKDLSFIALASVMALTVYAAMYIISVYKLGQSKSNFRIITKIIFNFLKLCIIVYTAVLVKKPLFFWSITGMFAVDAVYQLVTVFKAVLPLRTEEP